MSQPAVKRQRNTEMLRAPSVRDVGMSMLLLLAGRASVLGLFPFGVAFFASCFDKSIAYLGITVLSIALMTSAGSAVLTNILLRHCCFGYIHVSEIRKILCLMRRAWAVRLWSADLFFLYIHM